MPQEKPLLDKRHCSRWVLTMHMHANIDLYYAIHSPVYICIHSHKYFHETASPTHNQFRVPSQQRLCCLPRCSATACTIRQFYSMPLSGATLPHLYSLATIIGMQIKYFGEACGRLDPPIRNSISCIKLDHASLF